MQTAKNLNRVSRCPHYSESLLHTDHLVYFVMKRLFGHPQYEKNAPKLSPLKSHTLEKINQFVKLER